MRFNVLCCIGAFVIFFTSSCGKILDFCGIVRDSNNQYLSDASIIFLSEERVESCKTDTKGTCQGGWISVGSNQEGWLLVFKKGYVRKVLPYTADSHTACAEVQLQPSP